MDDLGLLNQFDRYALLSNGRSIHITPARPNDETRVRAFYARLGDDATYRRFLSVRRRIPDAEFQRLVNATLPNDATMLALIGGEIIGVGEYHANADLTEAEVAFAVSDDHHDEGVATLLLEDLAVIAEHVGIRRFTATTLPDNGPMQLVFRTAGMDEKAHFDEGLIDVVLDLSDHSGLRAKAAERERLTVGRSLAPFFSARHVAVFGDCGRRTLLAGQLLDTLDSTFAGRVSIIDTHRAKRVERLPAAPEPEPMVTPDLVIIAVPPQATFEALADCSRRGIRAALVLSAEPDHPAFLGASLTAAAHELRIRVLGPSFGITVPSLGLTALVEPAALRLGTTAVVVGDRRAASFASELAVQSIGVSALVDASDSSDVRIEDLLWYWADDPNTSAVLMALDHLPVGHRFEAAARAVSAGKPLLGFIGDDRDPSAGQPDGLGILHVSSRKQLVAAATDGAGTVEHWSAMTAEFSPSGQPADVFESDVFEPLR